MGWNRLNMGPLMKEETGETAGPGGAKKEEPKKEEPKEEAPPATPPGPKVDMRGLSPKEIETILLVARDDRLPLAARKELLGDHVPDSLFTPDRGWGDKAGSVAQAALLTLVGVAAGSAAIVVIVSSMKALLVTFGVLTPEASPALPPAAGPQLQLPPTASGAGGGGLCGSSFRPSGGGCRFSSGWPKSAKNQG